jgi:hypothetical protein
MAGKTGRLSPKFFSTEKTKDKNRPMLFQGDASHRKEGKGLQLTHGLMGCLDPDGFPVFRLIASKEKRDMQIVRTFQRKGPGKIGCDLPDLVKARLCRIEADKHSPEECVTCPGG